MIDHISVKYMIHESTPVDIQYDVFAYFPFSSKDGNGNFTSYEHIGQHGSCSQEYLDECRVATKEEYEKLHNELKGIYENPPDPCNLYVINSYSKY